MKSLTKIEYQLTFFLVFITSFTFGQESPDSAINKRIAILVNKYQNKTIMASEKKEIVDLNYKIQNEGFRLEEISHDYKGSLEKINQALQVWIAIRDTSREANNRKYRGYLLSHLGDFTNSKSEIFTAMNLFRSQHYDFGVAVSQFDMAKVYDLQQQLDSSVIYSKNSLNFWKIKKDTFRIVTGNNQMMHLFFELNKVDSCISIQKETSNLLYSKALHWRPTIDFYFLSYKIYQRKGDRKLFRYYNNLYKKKLIELTSNGLNIKSDYDTN